MPHQHCGPRSRRGLARVAMGFRCAFLGWVEAWRQQPNVRIHAALVLAVTALGLWLQLGAVEWAALALTFGLVLVAELLNSALEALIDLVVPVYDPLAGRAKDIAAGAVLVAAVVAIAVGLLILGPPLWARLVLIVRPRG